MEFGLPEWIRMSKARLVFRYEISDLFLHKTATFYTEQGTTTLSQLQKSHMFVTTTRTRAWFGMPFQILYACTETVT